jgi:hypothetical protein
VTDTGVVHELLNDQTYHIEFNGHLTNHAKHAVVALAGLGAPADAIKAYYDNYAKCTPYGYGLEAPKPSREAISEQTWKRFLGQRTNFSAYCSFFEKEQDRLGLEEVLRRYVPRLLPGWVGAFTHAAIHLGWGLDANSLWMTVEGLAYMAFSYVSCHPERGRPATGRAEDDSAVAWLLATASGWQEHGDELHDWVEALVANPGAAKAQNIHPELARSGLQYRIARVVGEGHPSMYELPAWIVEQDIPTSWEQLYEVVTLLYLARPGDFILLHLITSLHAMEQIANCLPHEQRRDVLKCFWIGMLGIVYAQADFPSPASLSSLHATHERAIDGGSAGALDDWASIVSRAVQEEEEHNPKLVYVLRRAWARTGGRSVYRTAAAHFTTTPELPKSFEAPPIE